MVRKLALNDEGEIAKSADDKLARNLPFGGNTFEAFARTAPSQTAHDAGLAGRPAADSHPHEDPAAERAGLGKNPGHGVGAAEVARRIMAAVRRG
jgi:hypothetical protein